MKPDRAAEAVLEMGKNQNWGETRRYWTRIRAIRRDHDDNVHHPDDWAFPPRERLRQMLRKAALNTRKLQDKLIS